jgi:hypothetical protein
MSDFQQQPDPQRPSFCQICGRGVATEADRLSGKAFPCGLCNEVKLAAPASTGYAYPGATYPGPTPGADPGSAGVPPIPPAGYPRPAEVPNPGLAALLGLIPGVGAMYNGQYAKGVVHLVVFAVLSSLVDSNGIFLIFVFGWVAYQSIEAHHTARARRDGTPLPNPFGLNDIGERLGFGKSWPSSGSVPPVPPVNPTASAQQPPVTNWGAPWEAPRYTAPPNPYAGYAPPQPPPNMPPYQPVAGTPPFDAPGYVPYDPIAVDPDAVLPVRNRFPAGAIWLIALGTLFLLNTSGLFRGLSFRLLLPIFFIGIGVWSFVHKMTQTGHGLADDGTPEYRIRIFRAARGAVWTILIGIIFFLADFNILSWGRSWPLFLILAGVMTFLERAIYSGMRPSQPPPYPGYGYPAPGPVPSAPVATPAPDYVHPTDSQEGR